MLHKISMLLLRNFTKKIHKKMMIVKKQRAERSESVPELFCFF